MVYFYNGKGEHGCVSTLIQVTEVTGLSSYKLRAVKDGGYLRDKIWEVWGVEIERNHKLGRNLGKKKF